MARSTIDRVQQFRIFVQVADCGSFVASARALNLPPATVSAAVKLLESDLGTRLLHRTTRHVSLTQEGQKILPMARKLAGDIDEIYSLLDAERQSVSGRLNIDVPGHIAARILAPALSSLLAKHPALELNVSSNDRQVDLRKEGIDCAIRTGESRGESLVCRRLGKLDMVNCASPAYLAVHGTPRHPDELTAHWITGYLPNAHPGAWRYVDADGLPHTVHMRYRIAVNSVDSYLACGLGGIGLIQMPRFDVRPLLASGDLLEVLPHWPAPPMPVSALYLHRDQRSPRLAAFIDWFQELLNRTVAQGSATCPQFQSQFECVE